MSDDPITWEDVIAEPDTRFDYEIPIVGRTWLLEEAEHIPTTELQALMETAPGQEPARSMEEMNAGQHSLMDIVDEYLSDEERAVIETTIFAGHSIRDASQMLGWPRTTVHRLQQSALERIRRLLPGGEL